MSCIQHYDIKSSSPTLLLGNLICDISSLTAYVQKGTYLGFQIQIVNIATERLLDLIHGYLARVNLVQKGEGKAPLPCSQPEQKSDQKHKFDKKNGEMCSSVLCQLSHQLSRASFVRFAAALFAISASTAAIAVEIDADTGLAEVVFEQSTSR